ncbi:MAG: hypothetical protein C0467_08325 [Planctomycetaceae bacterium]|nr:hypothetical protein [Planctomycetaceae bacterium]
MKPTDRRAVISLLNGKLRSGFAKEPEIRQDCWGGWVATRHNLFLGQVMMQSRWARRCGAGIVWSAFAIAVAVPLPTQPQVQAQPAGKAELTDGLRFVPPDAALFVYADVPKIWNSSIIKNLRNSDPKTIEFATDFLKKQLGLAPEDVKSVVVFVPKLKGPEDTERFGVAVTFTKVFDKAQLEKGAAQLLPKNAKLKVVVPDDRTAVVLLGLKEDEFGKPREAKPGPLSDALKAAASGKFAGVAGATLASLPDEIRGEDVPPQFRPFQPLLNAVTISATLDLAKDPTLNVVVKSGTARQAADCEKSLAAVMTLLQTQLEGGLKDVEKDAGLKDLVAVMNSAIKATGGAKYSTLGGETQMTVTLPGDLPFGGAFIEARKKVQEAGAALQATNNLKQIGLAMHGYHDTHGSMPPAAVCDKTGKPLLSWRVLILPYIEQDDLYKQFKLDEPWDSVNNKKLLAKMPKVYAIPGTTPQEGTETHYRVFVGNGAGFDWVMGPKIANITDGSSNTLMCVTAADAVPWTKPDELAFDPEKDPSKLFGAVVNGKVLIGMFDGSVRSLKKLPKKETLKALITKGGGEVIGDDFE